MGGGTGAILIYILLFFGIFYFLAIRPQRRQKQQHANLLATLKKGDQVVTIGGVYGTITAIGSDWVELEIARRTRVRMLKRAVASVTAASEYDEEEDDDEYVDADEGEYVDVDDDEYVDAADDDEYVDADEGEYLESDADVVEDEIEPAVEEPVAEAEDAQLEQAPEAPQPPKV